MTGRRIHSKPDPYIEGRAASARLFDLLFPNARQEIAALPVRRRQFYRDARPAVPATNQHTPRPRRLSALAPEQFTETET